MEVAPPTPPPSPQPAAPRPEVPRWIRQVRKLELVEVAEVLGMSIVDDRLVPCPRCQSQDGAEVFRTKKGWTLWRCKPCGIWGSGVLDLASYSLTGEKAGDLPPEHQALLRQWFEDQGWCDAEDE